MMWWISSLAFMFNIVLKHGVNANLSDPLVINGQILIDQKKICALDCKLPPFLSHLCEPVRPYLRCGPKLQENIKKFKSMNKVSSACSCMWRDVFNKARVDKLLFMEIVDFQTLDKTKIVRTRLLSIARLCRGFTNQLCGAFTAEFDPNSTRIKEGEWIMAPSRISQLLVTPQTTTKKAAAIGTGLFGMEKSQQVIIGIVVAASAVVLIVCLFFVIKLRKDVQPGFADGSLCYDSSEGRHRRTTSSYDKFMDKLRTNSRTKASEREHLLDKGTNNNVPCRTSRKIEKKKNRVKKYASQVSQGTQCDADEFDIATSFCISEENVHARTLTRMTMSASDSDSDEEARVFHSSLMYDKEEQEERLGRNTYGPSSSPQ